jgi:hypothetical protein
MDDIRPAPDNPATPAEQDATEHPSQAAAEDDVQGPYGFLASVISSMAPQIAPILQPTTTTAPISGGTGAGSAGAASGPRMLN